MPAGANGKLYGAVTSQSVAEELAKQGQQIERKRIELPGGGTLKNAGKYKVSLKLYGNAFAEVNLTVEALVPKAETKPAALTRRGRGRHVPDAEAGVEAGASAGVEAGASAGEEAAEAAVQTDAVAEAEAGATAAEPVDAVAAAEAVATTDALASVAAIAANAEQSA
jgi:large subunit ribosomal protein L9